MAGVIGYLEVELYMPGNHSLKEKRMVLKRVKERLKNKFNVSVSEISSHDKWQIGIIGVVTISSDSKRVDEILEKVVSFIEFLAPGIVKSYHKEIL